MGYDAYSYVELDCINGNTNQLVTICVSVGNPEVVKRLIKEYKQSLGTDAIYAVQGFVEWMREEGLDAYEVRPMATMEF